jgi:hypothetical protein
MDMLVKMYYKDIFHVNKLSLLFLDMLMFVQKIGVSIFMSAITPSIANVTECKHSIHRQCMIEISLVQAISAETS